MNSSFSFPQGEELHKILNLNTPVALEDLFSKSLTDPLQALLGRPRKNLRSRLVRLGFDLVQARNQPSPQGQKSIAEACANILEILHTGSLVIDDIQDGSTRRRGCASVHVQYGVPVALNAGNWLYFLPFKMIEDLPLPRDRRQALSYECQQTLLRAHYGQALDVGIAFDTVLQERVPEVSAAAIELKTGALSALALKMGALTLGFSDDGTRDLESFGKQFGVALQMLDDVGNLLSQRDPEKWAEDLKLKRIGFIAGIAAEILPREEYARYLSLCQMQNCSPQLVRDFLFAFGVFELAKERAHLLLQKSVSELRQNLQLRDDEIQELDTLQEQLMRAYD